MASDRQKKGTPVGGQFAGKETSEADIPNIEMSEYDLGYDVHGNIETKTYRHGDLIHRVNGPAVVNYDTEGRVVKEIYYDHGRASRVNGPAMTVYYRNGQVMTERYLIEGQCHRTDGPAIISYDENGQVTKTEFYTDGHHKPAPKLTKRKIGGSEELGVENADGSFTYSIGVAWPTGSARRTVEPATGLRKAFGLGGKSRIPTDGEEKAFASAN